MFKDTYFIRHFVAVGLPSTGHVTRIWSLCEFGAVLYATCHVVVIYILSIKNEFQSRIHSTRSHFNIHSLVLMLLD